MINTKDIYTKSAALLEEAKDKFVSEGATGAQYDFLLLKLMASIIHNDICREFHNLILNPTSETSKLLAFGPIILKLFEANRWYQQVGNKKLRELARNRDMLQFVENKLKKMKLMNPKRIEEYKGIRNRLIGHYDEQMIDVVQELTSIQSDRFIGDVEVILRYGRDWLPVLRSIGKLQISENTD